MKRHLPSSRSRDQFAVRIGENTVERDEFDVVQLQDIGVGGTQQLQTSRDALPDRGRAEVEVGEPVTARLGGDDEVIALTLQRLTEPFLGEPAVVVGRRVENVDARLHRAVDRLDPGVLVDGTEHVAQRRRPE
jgi:hypothetical protein